MPLIQTLRLSTRERVGFNLVEKAADKRMHCRNPYCQKPISTGTTALMLIRRSDGRTYRMFCNQDCFNDFHI